MVGFLIMLLAKPLEDSYSTRAVVNGPDQILRLGLHQLGGYSNQMEYVLSGKTTQTANNIRKHCHAKVIT